MVAKEKKAKLDVWPQRARFKELYENYRRGISPKKPMELVAEELGVAYTTLYSTVYDPKRPRPGLSLLFSACRLFGCEITEFIDNPNEKFEGLDGTEEAAAPEETRVAMRKIYSTLKNMTPEQIHDVMAVWETTTMIIRRQHEAKQN